MANNYNASSIKTLDPIEHMRKYPGMYISSKDEKGLLHCVKEIISNSIDEYLNGANKFVYVKILKDGGIYIKDEGRGIPHGKHESGCSILQACFGLANTGGKFNNATGETGYNSSGGEHGEGAKAVNAVSKRMIVTSSRENIKETVEFAKGRFVSSKKESTKEQGLEVTFYPDEEIFETVSFDSGKIEQMIREFSFLCSGLTFVFDDEIKSIHKKYSAKNGLVEYLEYLSKDKELIIKPIYIKEVEGTYQVEVALAYTNSFNSQIAKLYTNNIPQEKGTHLTGFKTAFTSAFNSFAREKKWLKDKDSNLLGSDLEEGQILVLNFKMIEPVFKGQAKEELTSTEGRTYVQKLCASALKQYFSYNERDIKKIADKAINARKAREAAKKASDAIQKGTTSKRNKKLPDLPTKLVDAWSKKRQNCELYICEGNSACAGLTDARDGEFQATFPIRGKLISLAGKNSAEKVFANQEIISIIKALGLPLNAKTRTLEYDKNKLRYGKIIFAADADFDGDQINNLLLTAIWYLCPSLVTEGHIYIAVPPLFRITTKKNEYIFLKGEKELEEYKIQHQNEKFLINRNKG